MVGASPVVSACIAVMALLIEGPALRIHAEGSPTQEEEKTQVIVLGVALLVVGFVTGIPVLVTIGGILLVIGVILGTMGRAVGGRKHCY